MRMIAAALLTAWLHVPAQATEPPSCAAARASALPSRPDARAVLARGDGLLAAREPRGALLLWAEDASAYISPELGALLTFAGGWECIVAVPDGQARGVRLMPVPGRGQPMAVEAGLCSKVGAGCLPVRLDIPR